MSQPTGLYDLGQADHDLSDAYNLYLATEDVG